MKRSVFRKIVSVLALSGLSLSLSGAAEDCATPSEGLSESTPKIFEAAFEFDFNSAYVWYNAVQNDQMVMQPCVWADITYFEPFWFGFSIWQNYNLTDRNAAYHRYGLIENDYGVFVGATLWSSEDGRSVVTTEVAHDWFTYPGVRTEYSCLLPETRDLRWQARFDNPYLNVYGILVWLYKDFGLAKKGFLYEVGLNREFEIADDLSVGADWNVSFGDRACMENLYGVGTPGVGGTTAKLYLVWRLTEWMSLGCTLAYTGVLNSTAREALGDSAGYWGDGSYDTYPRDLLWGGINLKLKY